MDIVDPVELAAGPDQAVVVYQPPDDGAELDPIRIFSVVARDAAERAANGEWIVTMAVLPLRHSAVAFGRDGSGFATKAAVAVVYGRVSKGASTGDR